jgi:7,8-dihydropterin-6-yl-methyl-4-(beta-D-ribofuranosyl)aminobenzene 5'-phosphate synthase
MDVNLTILTDNRVDRGDGLLAEHGLCVAVEIAGRTVLLDTGQSDICLRNALRLGVNLRNLGAVVLSHGHYDHGGGLPALLDDLGSLEVFAHPDVFASKYARRRDQEDRYIGLPYGEESLTARGAAVRIQLQPNKIADGLLMTGPIPRDTSFEDDDPHFWLKREDEWQPDCFDDEQALVIRTSRGLVVLAGCAHAGVINTLRHATALTGDDRIRAVIGGLHLSSAGAQRIQQTVAALREMEVGQVVACHCTGFAATMHLHATFGERLVNGAVGLRLTF